MNIFNHKAHTSIFKGMTDKNPDCTGWKTVYRSIVKTSLKEDTETFRELKESHTAGGVRFAPSYAVRRADELKRCMPAITPAALCTGGHGIGNVKMLTGVSMCDFDHVRRLADAMAKLRADKHVMMAYVTISGQGIRVLFRYVVGGEDDRIPTTKSIKAYARAFRRGNEYFERLIGEEYDRKCCDVTRMSVLCHDPKAYYNESAEPFDVDPKDGDKDADTAPAADEGATKVRMTVGEAAKTAAAVLEKEGIIYVQGNRNNYIARTGYLLNKMGVPEDEARTWAETRFADYGAREAAEVIRACYRKTEEHGTWKRTEGKGKKRGRKPNNVARASVEQLENIISSQVALRLNTVTKRTEICWDGDVAFKPLCDRDVSTLWRRINKTGIKATREDIENVINSEFTKPYDPFASYFGSLQPWDESVGDDPIATLADMVSVEPMMENETKEQAHRRFEDALKRWLVGLVAGVMSEKNEINHQILTLIGRQGIYKTTFFRNLLPPQLYDYYYPVGNNSMSGRDDRLATTEKAMICLEEIDSMSDREHNLLKAVVTQAKVSERAAYAHYREERRRIASFCATGNNQFFLSDITGHRRWMVFNVESIDERVATDIDHDAVYAQAYGLWKTGYRYWLTSDETKDLERHNSVFTVPSPEEELILTYFRIPKKGETYALFSATNIMETISQHYHQTLTLRKIGHIMTKLGFEQKRTSGRRAYKVVEMPLGEIKKMREGEGGGLFGEHP